ncbi:MAG: creatininase family protein [Vicinamibacterales bacterium]
MRVLLLVSILVLGLMTPGHVAVAQQQRPRGFRLADLTWQQAADMLRPETVVVIPLGAGSKEHGPHLKLSNDAIFSDYLTQRAVDTADVVVAPPLPYHYYPAFVEYPGSTSLTLETARALTVETVLSLAQFGPRRFYVLNTGVSTTRALEPAARQLARQGILLTFTDLAGRLDRVSAPIRQEEGGTHADEVETSMMLYIDPASVDMRRVVKEYSPSQGPLQLTRRRGGPGTFSESGVWGDPTLATRDKGRVIVEGLVAGILEDIEALRRATPPSASEMTSVPPPPSRSAFPQAGSPARPQSCTPGDERTIRGFGDAFTFNWNNGDALNLSLLWSVDGDMVHPDGLTERGRETIRANRAALFLRQEYRGSKHPLMLGNVRCVTPDTAVVDGKWELRGVTDAGGKLLPTFEGLLTLVLARGPNGWAIEAYRYTQKPAAVPMPTWLKRPGYPGNP